MKEGNGGKLVNCNVHHRSIFQIRLIRQIRGAMTLWFGLFTAINARSRW